MDAAKTELDVLRGHVISIKRSIKTEAGKEEPCTGICFFEFVQCDCECKKVLSTTNSCVLKKLAPPRTFTVRAEAEVLVTSPFAWYELRCKRIEAQILAQALQGPDQFFLRTIHAVKTKKSQDEGPLTFRDIAPLVARALAGDEFAKVHAELRKSPEKTCTKKDIPKPLLSNKSFMAIVRAYAKFFPSGVHFALTCKAAAICGLPAVATMRESDIEAVLKNYTDQPEKAIVEATPAPVWNVETVANLAKPTQDLELLRSCAALEKHVRQHVLFVKCWEEYAGIPDKHVGHLKELGVVNVHNGWLFRTIDEWLMQAFQKATWKKASVPLSAVKSQNTYVFTFFARDHPKDPHSVWKHYRMVSGCYSLCSITAFLTYPVPYFEVVVESEVRLDKADDSRTGVFRPSEIQDALFYRQPNAPPAEFSCPFHVVPLGNSKRAVATYVDLALKSYNITTLTVWKGERDARDVAAENQYDTVDSIKRENLFSPCTSEFRHKNEYDERQDGVWVTRNKTPAHNRDGGWFEREDGELVKVAPNFRTCQFKRKRAYFSSRCAREVDSIPLHRTYSLQDGELGGKTLLWKDPFPPTRLAVQEALRLTNKRLVVCKHME